MTKWATGVSNSEGVTSIRETTHSVRERPPALLARAASLVASLATSSIKLTHLRCLVAILKIFELAYHLRPRFPRETGVPV